MQLAEVTEPISIPTFSGDSYLLYNNKSVIERYVVVSSPPAKYKRANSMPVFTLLKKQKENGKYRVDDLVLI